MKIKPPQTKTKEIFFRVSPDEHEAFMREAYSKNMKLSAWIRAVLLQKLGLERTV